VEAEEARRKEEAKKEAEKKSYSDKHENIDNSGSDYSYVRESGTKNFAARCCPPFLTVLCALISLMTIATGATFWTIGQLNLVNNRVITTGVDAYAYPLGISLVAVGSLFVGITVIVGIWSYSRQREEQRVIRL